MFPKKWVRMTSSTNIARNGNRSPNFTPFRNEPGFRPLCPSLQMRASQPASQPRGGGSMVSLHSGHISKFLHMVAAPDQFADTTRELNSQTLTTSRSMLYQKHPLSFAVAECVATRLTPPSGTSNNGYVSQRVGLHLAGMVMKRLIQLLEPLKGLLCFLLLAKLLVRKRQLPQNVRQQPGW